jgi:hypothetical protein
LTNLSAFVELGMMLTMIVWPPMLMPGALERLGRFGLDGALKAGSTG